MRVLHHSSPPITKTRRVPHPRFLRVGLGFAFLLPSAAPTALPSSGFVPQPLRAGRICVALTALSFPGKLAGSRTLTALERFWVVHSFSPLMRKGEVVGTHGKSTGGATTY